MAGGVLPSVLQPVGRQYPGSSLLLCPQRRVSRVRSPLYLTALSFIPFTMRMLSSLYFPQSHVKQWTLAVHLSLPSDGLTQPLVPSAETFSGR